MRKKHIKMKYKLIALILMAATINSCGGGSSQNAKAQSAESETKVLIKTTAGDITIKLYNETPQHRDNFIKLVQENYYDSILFHRVIRDFMVQAGDPESKTAEKYAQLGSGGPGYNIPAEFVYPKYFHKRGNTWDRRIRPGYCIRGHLSPTGHTFRQSWTPDHPPEP